MRTQKPVGLLCISTMLLLACGTSPVGEDESNGGEDCVPETCESLSVECGEHEDSCGDFMECGACEEGYECEEGLCVEICVPESCETLGARCGLVDDGCGETIDCGECGDCPDDPLCITPEPGAPDAAISVEAGATPELAGGALSDGWLELQSIRLYTDGFISSSFATSISITSNGDTHGSLEFWGEEWGLAANLDLHVYIETSMMGPMEQDFAGAFSSGGCFQVSGNRILGDLLQCGGQWVQGSEPPDGVDFEVGPGQVHILVLIPRQVFIDSLPSDYQQWGDMIITGDLPVLMSFEEPGS